MARIAEALRQPIQIWQTCSSRAMLALTWGHLEDAELLIPEALTTLEKDFPHAIPV